MTNINNLINKHQTVVAQFDFEEKQREFKKLAELKEKTKYTILAVFINNNSKFGDGTQGLFVTDDFQVNLPHHLTDLAKDLRQDEEIINAINNRELAFEVYQYNGKNGVGYSLNLTPSAEQNAQDDTKGRAFNNDDTPAF